MKTDRLASYILIAVVVVALAAVAYILINPAPAEKFTEFYILGPEGMAGNYPNNLTVGETANLTMGIVNHESITSSYQLVVRWNDAILKDENFTLNNGEKKEIPFTFQAQETGTEQKLEFLLFKLPNNKQPYRSLFLLIDVN